MYGAQAAMNCDLIIELFENDVEMYGAQARGYNLVNVNEFENDVEMYGAQAINQAFDRASGLRMM